jgi:DNA topoisomerase VI subunit B
MKKEIIFKNVFDTENIWRDLGDNLKNFITELNGYLSKIPKEYQDKAFIEFKESGFEMVSYNIYYLREETDEEYNERIRKIADKISRLEIEERKELERLKLKYEN